MWIEAARLFMLPAPLHLRWMQLRIATVSFHYNCSRDRRSRLRAADCGRLSFRYNEFLIGAGVDLAADCGRLSFRYNVPIRTKAVWIAADCGRLSFRYNPRATIERPAVLRIAAVSRFATMPPLQALEMA